MDRFFDNLDLEGVDIIGIDNEGLVDVPMPSDLDIIGHRSPPMDKKKVSDLRVALGVDGKGTTNLRRYRIKDEDEGEDEEGERALTSGHSLGSVIERPLQTLDPRWTRSPASEWRRRKNHRYSDGEIFLKDFVDEKPQGGVLDELSKFVWTQLFTRYELLSTCLSSGSRKRQDKPEAEATARSTRPPSPQGQRRVRPGGG
ncbi:hypothetical protein Drorol1_Dr00018193 [Drosera rotundifolia]